MSGHIHGFGSVRLSRRHERWLYALGGLLLVSGLGWLIAHYFLATAGEFGETHHASEPWWLRIHGAAAMGFLVAFGTLLPVHIVRAWHLGKNRRTGVLMLIVIGLLGVTAYGLYYAGGDVLRTWLSAIHWITGFAATAGLIVHAWKGKHLRHHRVHRKPIQRRIP